MVDSEIMVSVVCTVYNHEKFIKRALESIVTQKCSFLFEVIVHDDASNDRSAEIIREYAQAYPSIVRAVCQNENQYSKGINIFETFVRPIVRGKYIAICEGDDCWLDDKKLSKQVDYMETHPNCTFCFTNAIMENVQNRKKRLMIPYYKSDMSRLTHDGIYNVGQLAQLSFIPYASFLFPTQNYHFFPDYFFERCFGGDRKISLFSTALGYGYFINEPTCCYHYGVKGSAMTKKRSKQEFALIERSFVSINNNVNKFSCYAYKEVFDALNLPLLRNILMLSSEDKPLSDEEYSFVFDQDSFAVKAKRVCVKVMPNWFFNFLRGLKRKISCK